MIRQWILHGNRSLDRPFEARDETSSQRILMRIEDAAGIQLVTYWIAD
jgi:hypothetical protein